MTSLMFSCIWLLETIFGFYMDVVDNNDFPVFGCGKQYLDFTWMFGCFSCIWLFKTIFGFYMDVVDNNDFLFMYLVVENNIYILHGCCG